MMYDEEDLAIERHDMLAMEKYGVDVERLTDKQSMELWEQAVDEVRDGLTDCAENMMDDDEIDDDIIDGGIEW